MNMCKKCDHNHAPDPLTEYLSAVFPIAPPTVLEDIINMGVIELFIRTPKGEWDSIYDAFISQFIDILDEEDHPKELDRVFAERDRQQAGDEAATAAVEMQSDLDDVLSTQGVLDDEEVYGQYL